MTYKRLTRSITERKIAGICGGLGDYFGIDPNIVRVAFLFLLLFGGGGLLLYIILWIILPEV